MPKTERNKKTPAERATERLGVATRAVDAIKKKIAKLEPELAALRAEQTAAESRLTYVSGDPDLPANHTQPIPEVDAVAKPKRGRAVTDNPQA